MLTNLLLRLAIMTPRTLLIICLATGGVYYFTMFDDGGSLRTQIDAVAAEVEKEKVKAAEAERALKEVDKMRASVASLSDQFILVSKQLPSQFNMPELIKTIDSISRASGVAVKTKEPRPPMSERGQEIVEVLPVHVILEGQFSEISMFIYYISSLEKITRVKNFKMNIPSTNDKNPRLIVDAEVLSYRFVGVGPTAAGKGTSP